MAFPARYPGVCEECGTRIHLGDLITGTEDGDGWVHASCDDICDAPETCFLTTCDCERSA